MKVPEPRKLPSGMWFIQLRLNGESIPITERTERACKLKAELIKAEHRSGLKALRTSDKTVYEAIGDYIEHRNNVLSPSTIRGYRCIQRNRFRSIMQRPFSKVQNWQSIINTESKLCSAKTLKNAFLFIKSVALENGITIPPVRLPMIVPNEHPFLDPEQIPIFMEAVKGKKVEYDALLGLHGLRQSEILAIKKSDISNGIIHVHGAVVPDENHKFVMKKTNKNSTSKRTVPIMIPRLSELAKAGSNHLPPRTMLSNINAACRSVDLPEIGIHGLRHSFASLAYHLGLSEMQTMRLGGWSNPATMRAIYTHLSTKDKDEAAEKITNFFENAEKNANENANGIKKTK